MEFTPIILVHLLAATGAIVTGGLALGVKKGSTLHRALGRTWALLMLIAALVSFGIKTGGDFSWIHLLSAGVLLALGASVTAAIRGRIAAHRRGMICTYIGLVVAGAFTLLPARRFGHLVWSAIGLI